MDCAMEQNVKLKKGGTYREGVLDFTAGGTVSDTALVQTGEGVAVPDMLNGQCILLQLMHEGSNGRRSGKRGCTI